MDELQVLSATMLPLPPATTAPPAAPTSAASPVPNSSPTTDLALPGPQQMLDQALRGSRYVQPHNGVGGNSISLYTDEKQAIPALVKAIHSAAHVINIAIFSWEASGAGATIAKALMESARRGVEVNVQVDGLGSMLAPFGKNKNLMDRMKDAGIHVVVTNRLSRKKGVVQAVDHRKLVVIDGKTMFTGGMNMSGRYSSWHDALARFDGPIAAQAGAEFIGRWVDGGGKVSNRQRALFSHTPPPANNGNAMVRVVTTKPKVHSNASDSLISRINSAKDRVWIESPWISDDRVASALQNAARRNVDVRVAVTGPKGWIGSPALNMLSRSFYVDLASAGVKIYEQGNMSHAKLSLIDGVATIGSTNLSQRSLLHDYELCAEVVDPTFAKQIARFIDKDMRAANRITDDEIDLQEKSLSKFRHMTGWNY